MQLLGNAVATLIAVGVIAAGLGILIWRLKKGVGYWSNPPTKFTRAEDPFSFWLSVAIPAAAALFLLIAGGAALLAHWRG